MYKSLEKDGLSRSLLPPLHRSPLIRSVRGCHCWTLGHWGKAVVTAHLVALPRAAASCWQALTGPGQSHRPTKPSESSGQYWQVGKEEGRA